MRLSHLSLWIHPQASVGQNTLQNSGNNHPGGNWKNYFALLQYMLASSKSQLNESI